MTDIPILPGITSTFVDTPRLRQHVLSCGPAGGTPIVFIHGNFSAATYWEELMLALAGHFDRLRTRLPLHRARSARVRLDGGQADRRHPRLSRLER